jgi:hypothetical protein
MNAMRKLRGMILADSNARIETAKAILAEAEAHKAIVLDLLAKGREELVEDLATVEKKLPWAGSCQQDSDDVAIVCTHGHYYCQSRDC